MGSVDEKTGLRLGPNPASRDTPRDAYGDSGTNGIANITATTATTATNTAETHRSQFQAVLDKARKEHHTDRANLDVFNRPPMTNVSALLNVIGLKNQEFDAFRGKNQKIYSTLRSTLTPIEVVGGMITGLAEEVFAPTQHIFSAVMFLVSAARGVSDAYDSIVSVLEQLSFFTKRLNLYAHVKMEPDTIELLAQIMALLFEVIIITTHAIGKGRAKSFVQNLFGGDNAIAGAVGRLETLFGAERGQIIAEIYKHMGDLQNTVRDGFQDTQHVLEKVQMNQGRLIEDLSSLKQSMLTLRQEESLHGDKLRMILNPCPYPEDLYTRFHTSMAKNTGTWIMHEPALASWICSEWPFLLMYGSPGVGKSYLTTFLITSLSKLFSESGDKSGHNSLGSVFFRNDNPQTRSVHQALCDMAAQLSDDDVYYSKYLLKNITSSEDIKTIPSAFRKLILDPIREDLRQRKVFLLFDGLDEAPWEEVEELLFAMKDLDTNSNIQVLLTGRPELQEPVTQVLDDGGGVGDKLHYLHITPEKNRADVRVFIEEGIMKARNMRNARPDPESFKRTVIREISKKAGGVFIMAALMVADVTNVHMRHPQSILNSLKDYPSSVSDLLYKVVVSMAQTISAEQCGDLNECLAWVSLAEETLTLGQLEAILTLKLGMQPWDLEHSLRGTFSSFLTLDREDGMTTSDLLDRRERAIPPRDTSPGRSMVPDDLNFSSNLDQTDVVFFHASLGDFFRSDASTNIAVGERHIGFDENEALVNIAQTCLRVFAEPGFCEDDTSRLKIYAPLHWQRHITRINLDKTPATEKTILLRLVHQMLTHEQTIFNWTDFSEYKTLVHSHGTLLGIQRLLADPLAVKGLDSSKETSIISWSKAGATDLHAIIKPMGKTFAHAWLHHGSGVSRQGIHKSTVVCSNFVQNVAYLKKGYTWRSQQDDSSLTFETKLDAALDWADQERSWWWHLRVGSTWMTAGQYIKALDHYDEARRIGGDVVSTSARIAVCYQRQRKYQDALDLYLMCEAKEQELLETGQVTGQVAHLNQMWRLYKDQIQAAECFVKLNRIDEAAEYYRKAIKNSYDKSLFDAETAYIALMIKHNRFKEITTVLQQMDRPNSGDPHKLGTRLINFLISKATESVVLEWIPRTACRKDAIPFAKEQYKMARNEAKREEDIAAEFALQFGRGAFHIYARDYSHALDDLETMCYLYYRPKGSLPIRSIQTQALKRLAYLYKQLALHTEEYMTGGDSTGRWTGRLETLEQRLRDNQNLDIPLQFVGQSHNDATLYRGLLKRKGGEAAAARDIFKPLVLGALDILDDDEPQNDTYALDNLARVLMAAGEIEDATALHQSMRPPDSKIVARVASVASDSESEEAMAITKENKTERREPVLPSIVTQTPFCTQCLNTLDDSQAIGVCEFCLDPFCLACLKNIKTMETKKWEDRSANKRHSIASRQEDAKRRRSTGGGGGGSKMGPMILESSCRKDHDWVIVKPLAEALGAGEIFVAGKVIRIATWKRRLRQKWGGAVEMNRGDGMMGLS